MDAAEARLLVDAGVTHLGFPLRLPHGGEDLSEDAAAEVIAAVPGPQYVLITYLDAADAIAALCRQLGVGIVQLHGPIAIEELDRLRRASPSLGIIKSLIVRGDNLAALEREIAATAARVDAYITDTFDPATGRSGATGRVHDWALSERLVALSPRPVLLAGGLDEDHVAASVAAVGPAGVDAHTGLEAVDGRKDPVKVKRFVERARAAFAAR
ncbi:MAG: phosphoribosylanthranilate isomerase [Pseudomonadota bacterium]